MSRGRLLRLPLTRLARALRGEHHLIGGRIDRCRGALRTRLRRGLAAAGEGRGEGDQGYEVARSVWCFDFHSEYGIP